MSTQDIKEELKNLYPQSSDWKRVSKQGTGDTTVRLFKNSNDMYISVVGADYYIFVEHRLWTFAI